jgi:hypothetical protein
LARVVPGVRAKTESSPSPARKPVGQRFVIRNFHEQAFIAMFLF